jgi:hypothetical protein
MRAATNRRSFFAPAGAPTPSCGTTPRHTPAHTPARTSLRLPGGAAGSSSSASAAVAHRLGLVDRNITVHMPGGKIGIEIGDEFSIMMTGTVNKVAEGHMHAELFAVKV